MIQKLLLTSVFKPFSIDDAYGMKENVCELMHNQVTRIQGVYSIRTHNRSFGLTMIATNLKVPTTVLDFPTEQEFIRELRRGAYTHVGISFIVPNFDKARRMCELTRKYAPKAKILLGGHGVRIEGIRGLLDCDEICPGEGIAFLRNYFGEDTRAPIRHPAIPLDCYRKIMGVEVPNTKICLIPGVGCKNKCFFCCTSHHFDGYFPFLKTAEELYEAMDSLSFRLSLREFFILDENFLDDVPKILRLVQLFERHQRYFVLDIFSSLRAISQYDPAFLARMGVQFVWIGIESRKDLFDKTKGLDAPTIIANLKKHGISVLTSTILFLDHHDERTLQEDVDYTISLKADFIQFMQLAPLPGTALFEDLDKSGRIRRDVPMKEWHGQDKIWFTHPVFSREQSKKVLDAAFRQEFETLGPSLLRIAETRLIGLKNLPANPDPYLAKRYQVMKHYAREMRPLFPAVIRFAPNASIRRKAIRVMREFDAHFGPATFLETAAAILVNLLARIESRRVRLKTNVSQPKTYIERYRQ